MATGYSTAADAAVSDDDDDDDDDGHAVDMATPRTTSNREK